MEVVSHQQSDKPLVLVDYAHTPDALEKVLKALRALPQKKITVVFGCGGDRDRGKRPMMRQIAETWADCVIVTSDNPRTEDPESIIRDIVGTSTKVKVMVDRREAIAWAIASTDASGVVLLAGKGHEETMEIAGRKIPFDDRSVAREFLQ
jgi:UDP-N-acetylmuramoyl-L-alanyl-D-glutamate--2,6-diaminopimelate ligase